MPTPFTHLETAQRLLQDSLVPAAIRDALSDERGAFLLGNVAADARTESGLSREATHFYSYDRGIHEHPWRVMLAQNPSLETPQSPGHRAFLAGYVAHLSMDEWWSLKMLGPHFALREWAPRHMRFFLLHILLIYVDERDLSLLLPWQYDMLRSAAPNGWLPFLNDRILNDWRDFISMQIAPGGHSQTLQVFGSRINQTPADLRRIMDDPARMQADLWQHITPALLSEIESGMYAFAREQLITYWHESGE